VPSLSATRPSKPVSATISTRRSKTLTSTSSPVRCAWRRSRGAGTSTSRTAALRLRRAAGEQEPRDRRREARDERARRRDAQHGDHVDDRGRGRDPLRDGGVRDDKAETRERRAERESLQGISG
jgi:hypothetical protein